MKRLNPRETIILTITFVLVAVYILVQFLIRPIHEGAVDIDDRLRSDRKELAKATHMVDEKPAADARYRNLVALIGGPESDDAQMPTIVSKIESAARDTNVHIGNIQPQKTASQKEAEFVAVEVEIDGQWLDIVKFLYELQVQPNYYFINELNLEKYSDSANSLRGRIVISRMCLVNP